MNMIATNMLPSDEQIYCDHIIGIFCNGVVAHTKDAERLKKFGGLGWTYCPICGCLFEEAA